MIQLQNLPGIQHLLDEDASLLDFGKDRSGQTVVLVDTGSHRAGSGRYVTWIIGPNGSCLLGHYVNDRCKASRDFCLRTQALVPTEINEGK